jgi:hypothetical protein
VPFTHSHVKLLTTDSRAAAAMPMGGRTNNKLAAESSQRQSRRRQRSAIQTIYDISKDIFAAATQGFQPLPSDMARLSGFLSTSHHSLCLSGLARGKESLPLGKTVCAGAKSTSASVVRAGWVFPSTTFCMAI